MVTAGTLRRRVDRLEGADGQIFVFHVQEGGSVHRHASGKDRRRGTALSRASKGHEHPGACLTVRRTSVIQRSWM
jgi:hypothetical protein